MIPKEVKLSNVHVMNGNQFNGEAHGRSHPKSETEGTRVPTKWTSVQQKLF